MVINYANCLKFYNTFLVFYFQGHNDLLYQLYYLPSKYLLLDYLYKQNTNKQSNRF